MSVQILGVDPGQCPGPSSATIAIDGTFDRRAAEHVRDTVLALRGTADIWLDFGHAQAVKDFALAQAAGALTLVAGAHIHLRGLSDHQDRVLRYLGFNPTLLNAPEAGDMAQQG